MGDFFTVELLTAVLRTATPLLFAALGGLLSERSGVMNIALEGFMLLGAFTAVAGTYYLHDPFLGLLCGALAAAAGAAIHAVWCISLRADQIVAGIALNLLGAGIPIFLMQRLWEQAGRTPSVEKLPMIASGVSILVPVAFLLVPVVWYLLERTKPGLRIQAAGEHPQAAESVGIRVSGYRYACVIASGVLAGIGGAFLSIGDLSLFTRDMTQGRGFIALAAVIFGNWNPLGTLAATLLFAGAQAFQVQAQAAGVGISADLLLALPYLLTLIAITGLVRHSRPPAGLGRHPTVD
ncbi:MAG TPA: ABC transporter permease [Thermomicrobiales bacterium]